MSRNLTFIILAALEAANPPFYNSKFTGLNQVSHIARSRKNRKKWQQDSSEKYAGGRANHRGKRGTNQRRGK